MRWINIFIYIRYCPKIMPVVEELWNSITSSYKNWRKKIKWFSILLNQTIVRKIKKETKQEKSSPVQPSGQQAGPASRWPSPTARSFFKLLPVGAAAWPRHSPPWPRLPPPPASPSRRPGHPDDATHHPDPLTLP